MRVCVLKKHVRVRERVFEREIERKISDVMIELIDLRVSRDILGITLLRPKKIGTGIDPVKTETLLRYFGS